MELNKSSEMNEPPLLEIGRQSYNVVQSENEHQPGVSVWSPMDCNGAGASSMSEIWQAEWRPCTSELSDTPSLQAQHRVKRQHFWTSVIPEEQGPGPGTLNEEDSMQGFHTELSGCCETGIVGNTGFDFFQSAQNSASSSRSPHPLHNLIPGNSSRQETSNGAGQWNTGFGQGAGLGSFFLDGEWKMTRDLMSNEHTENKKGKSLEQLHASGAELGEYQELSGFSNVLASHQTGEKGKSGTLIDCSINQRCEEVHGDYRGAYKRKMSPVDFSDASPFDSCFAPRFEIASSRSGVFSTSSDQNGFSNVGSISNPLATPVWVDSRNGCTDHANSDLESSRGVAERTFGFIEHGEDPSRNLQAQPFGVSGDTQLRSQSLFTRNLRRSVQAHGFTRRISDPVNNNLASSTSLLAGSDHWPPLGSERSPPPLPAMANWGSNSGSRRSTSAFTSPGSRERGSSQGAYEGARFRSTPGRNLDWAMAAVAAASPAALEPRPTSQLFASAGIAAPTHREVEPPESSARISQAASSLFNTGILASYFPSPESSNSRIHMNTPHPSQHGSAVPLEPSSTVAGQHAGRYPTLSPSRGRREALFSAPVQSVFGSPFRGLHTLRADGEYRRQFLSEILNAMHHAFRSEDLNIEELVMLDPSIVYGGADAHDQHRDMRLDVDNMTYEELLALGDRIGNVSTGLDEERIALCLRESKYSSLDATLAAISQDSDVKCSVCQEEFVEEDELGRLDCGHGYHSTCIKQWLLQKNECPICKASAYMK